MPRGHWKTTTFTDALRLTGMTAPFVYDGAMNGNVFRAYVEQVLVPTLSEGDIVVDNLPAHKTAGVRAGIEAVGTTLMFLPPYRPDFNLIENAFAKLKVLMRAKASGQSPPHGTPSVLSSNSFRQPNAQTTSRQQDMIRIKPDVL